MSGFTPIEFTKAATKEGGRLPTNEEKDADALQRVAAAFGSAPEMNQKVDSANPGPQLIAGEASGSGVMKPESMAADLAASFDPSAAAGAINAVIVPPTSAAGLEDGVEHMEVDKKSDDDWLIADPVPLTETEMVGTFLQDQEKKNREQYGFLTQEDANMETVKDTLSALTEHIHRLSVGDFQEEVVGPQTDGPKRVEVEPAGDKLPRVAGLQEALHLLVLGDHCLMVNGHRIIHLIFRGEDILLECCSGSVRPKGPWFWDQTEGGCHLLSTGLLCQVLLPGFLDAGLSVKDAGPWAIQVAPFQALFVVLHVQLSEHLGSQSLLVCHTEGPTLHLPQDFCRQCDCFFNLCRVHLWGFNGITKCGLPQLHRLGRSWVENLLTLSLVLLLLEMGSLIALGQGFHQGRIWGIGHNLVPQLDAE